MMEVIQTGICWVTEQQQPVHKVELQEKYVGDNNFCFNKKSCITHKKTCASPIEIQEITLRTDQHKEHQEIEKRRDC